MTKHPVIIAGGGIGGLATALTLHQIGVPCVVFEAVREMRPLGVGINMQPNAVREIYDLGITQADLDRVGLPAKEWALVGLNGNDIYSESRGLLAGYQWPQYAVHRGRFHMLLHDKLIERAGRDAVRLGHRVTGYRKNAGGSVTALIERADGSAAEARPKLPRARQPNLYDTRSSSLANGSAGRVCPTPPGMTCRAWDSPGRRGLLVCTTRAIRTYAPSAGRSW